MKLHEVSRFNNMNGLFRSSSAFFSPFWEQILASSHLSAGVLKFLNHLDCVKSAAYVLVQSNFPPHTIHACMHLASSTFR